MARIIISIAPGGGGSRRIFCDVTGEWQSDAEPVAARLALSLVAENMRAIAPVSVAEASATSLACFEVRADLTVPCATAMESTLCFLGLDARFAEPGEDDHHG